MEKYNTGEVWWIRFPYEENRDIEKRRSAIVLSEKELAILSVYVTSKDKMTPYSIEIEDWAAAGLKIPSWARIDKIVSINERKMDRKIGELSQKDLSKIFQLATECLSGIKHEFSLIAIRNSEGKYLQRYDTRWDSWLFPYIKSTDNNKANVDDFVSEIFQTEISTDYKGGTIHCKYSVSDDVYKIYNHKLYEFVLEQIPPNMIGDTFVLSDLKYCWMSFEEMENNQRVMETNKDVVAFVKSTH